MPGCDDLQTLGYFALVSYIPGPLAGFLDQLRVDLMPDARPRAHVTVLPPRPIRHRLQDVIRRIKEKTQEQPPFLVEMGSVEVFGGSNVVYIELTRGAEELNALYGLLNHGPLAWTEPFPYHPHITLAQNLPNRETALLLAQRARDRWAEWDGPRSFLASTLLFVQHVAPHIWADVAPVTLLAAVPVG